MRRAPRVRAAKLCKNKKPCWSCGEWYCPSCYVKCPHCEAEPLSPEEDTPS